MPTVKTVLVVDDEESVREFIASTLSLEGYQVFLAEDYTEALAICEDPALILDLLVTDVSLPGRNGCEVATDVLANRPNLKVLYISGSAGFEVLKLHGGRPEGAAFLPKPFEPSQLLDCLRRLIAEYEQMTASHSIRCQ